MDTVNYLFNGHKTQCKRRCKSWFSLQPDLERACKNLCKSGRTKFNKEEFLCQEGIVDEEVIMLAYGYDPCEGGLEMEEVLDPLDSQGQVGRDIQQYRGILLAGGLLLVLALGAMIYILR
ncbi:MAG: hypothetical protein AAF242_09825 [Bacteroidota bacterium]